MARAIGVLAVMVVAVIVAIHFMSTRVKHMVGPPPGEPISSRESSKEPGGEPASKEFPVVLPVAPLPGEKAGAEDNSDERESVPNRLGWEIQIYRHCVELFWNRHFDQARACFELQLFQNPDDAESRLNLGIAAARMGDREEACLRYREFVSLEPEDKRAGKIKSMIAKCIQEKKEPAEERPPEVELPETLSKSEIAATIKKYLGAMKGCVSQQQQRDPSVTGTMKVSFVVNGDGKTSDVKILTEEHRKSYVSGCIQYVFKNMKFPRFTGEPIAIPSLPLVVGR